MRTDYKGASAIGAQITDAGPGGFTAIASTGSLDRDGEIVQPHALTLPKSVPVHSDHVFSVENIVGRGVPYYRGDSLMIDVTFDSSEKAQELRRKVVSGLVDSMSIVFKGTWKTIDGVRTCVSGELLAVDLVSIPSQPDARILAARGWGRGPATTDEARAEAVLALARAEIATAKAFLAEARANAGADQSTTAQVRAFLRGL